MILPPISSNDGNSNNIYDRVIMMSEQFINNPDGLQCPDDDGYREFVEYYKPLADRWLEKNINRYILSGKSELLLAQYNEQLRISERMEALFGKTLDFNVKGYIPKKYLTIIRGIKETVRIKKDALKEGVCSFKKGYWHIEEISEVSPFISDEDKEANFKECLEKWVEFSRDESVTDFANSLKRDSDVSFKIKKEVLKQKIEFEKSLADLIFKFMRDIILSEISTFEEMVNHSLLLLEKADEEGITEFAKFVKDVYLELLSIIGNIGIELIKPEPYEMFNSRENSVLIAEESEGFGKGQIIKTVLCGYKQGETVIMRANVIAAK